MKFHKFRNDVKRSAIEINPLVDLDDAEMLSYNSSIVNQNNFEITRGRKKFDFISFEDTAFFAISKNVKEKFEEENVSGISYLKINIKGINDEYFAIIITSKAGPILNSTDYAFGIDKNAEFDKATWDGSDIFTLEDTLIIACTERVKEIIETNKFSNVLIREL